MERLETKKDLLTKLRAYSSTPDDETIQYKKKIEDALLSNPCLLYALNESSLYKELFDPSDKAHWEYDEDRKIYVPTEDCRLNWEWDEEKQEYEPLGEWDRYFSTTSNDANIRPYIFIPETQTEVKHYLCYQVGFRDTVRYQPGLKETQVTFTIFVHGGDRMDKWTGIPRHDLIASIIRERFAWSNIFGMQTHLVQNYEATTDNNYVTRTLVFELTDLNSKVQTPYGGKSQMMNYQLRR